MPPLPQLFGISTKSKARTKEWRRTSSGWDVAPSADHAQRGANRHTPGLQRPVEQYGGLATRSVLTVTASRTWSGEEWEDYVLALLRLHYAVGELVEIPDRDRGDAGLEAFTRDGCAYQCYAPEEPLSVNERYVKQRDKMTRDLGKFVDHPKLAPLLGRTVVRRWILVVPLIDSKRLIEHARIKSEEVQSEGLAYVHRDFEALVVTDDSFQRERAEVVRLGLAEISLDTPEPSTKRLLEFAEARGSLVDTLDAKLAKIPALAEREPRAEYKNVLLASYLRGTDSLDRLHSDFPDLARPIDQVIVDTRRKLVLRHQIMGAPPGVTLTQIVDDLSTGVGRYVSGLRQGDVADIAYSAAAQWLMECPLDFPGAE